MYVIYDKIALHPTLLIMKQYIHPNRFFIASPDSDPTFDEPYYAVNTRFGDEVSEGTLFCSESDIKSLWFIEKEEETDTDTKWIDDAIEDMHIDDYINDPYRESLRFYIKKAILSHLPKQWK